MIEFVNNSTVELVQSNASDEMVAMAAWVSNNLNDESRLEDKTKVQGLINFLYRQHHSSPFEHGQFTFKVVTPIFVAREFMRHRTMSFNEMSGRYTEMKPIFYVPAPDRPIVQSGKIGSYRFVPGDTHQTIHVAEALQNSSELAWERYIALKNSGVANEVARMVLPVNIMTEFYATVNPRNLMHFLDLRTDQQALHEIREVANKMEDIFSQQMPMTYKAYKRYKVVTVDTDNEVQ